MEFSEVPINFHPDNLVYLNLIIGLLMFGVALDMKLADFRAVRRLPLAIAVGLSCQFMILPAVTYGLVLLFEPAPQIALGMFLVAACPGGNLSNILTYFGKGNIPLSISMSTISTLAAIVMTPLNFGLWASLYEPSDAILKDVHLDPVEVIQAIVVMLVIPLVLGMRFNHQWPATAKALVAPMRGLVMLLFLIFVIGGLSQNYSLFSKYIGYVFVVVLIHNAIAFGLGYGFSGLCRLPAEDRRAVSFETGIQNSGFGLVLVLQFFGTEFGGTALIAAWWGIWHLISGGSMAAYWFFTNGGTWAELFGRTD